MNPHVFEDAMDGTMGLADARRSQALGERRAEKMRLRTPRVTQVQSDDGSTSLSNEGLDMSHDLSGEDYVLRVRKESGEAAARARIRTMTYTVARDFAKKEGVDLSNLDRDERSQYQQRFADQHGHRMEVLLFKVLEENNHDLQKLSRQFCLMYLELRSSFKYNHPDYPEFGDGYYPDKIYFCPYDVDPKLYMTVSAGAGLGG